MRSVLLLVAMFFCAASAVAYRESYREQSLGRGRFLITTQANEYNDSGDAHQFAFSRAKELCPDGFDILSQDGQAVSHTNTLWVDKGGFPIQYNSEKHEVALVVQCLPPEPPVGAQTPAATVARP